MRRTSAAILLWAALASPALASRNTAGTCTPTASGTYPFATGTAISSVTMTSLFTDVYSILTDSLSRSGYGGMTAPLFDRGYRIPNWFEVAMFLPGTYSANQVLARVAFTNSTTIGLGLPNAAFWAGLTATGSTVIQINKRAGSTVTPIGTLTYGIGATAPTVSFSGTITFAAGNSLEIIAPASPDATLGDLSITIQAQRL